MFSKAVFVFPGQGSQYVGMGLDIYNGFNEAKEFMDEAEKVIGNGLLSLCFNGPEDVLTRTNNVQPAITLINLACFMILKSRGINPFASAGHSLGEYAALAAADVMDPITAMRLVTKRGMAMQKAAQKNSGSMAAILGMEQAIVEEIAKKADVDIANYNSQGQIIISGLEDNISRAVEYANEQGAKKTVLLKVSGPWHSRFMTSARDEFSLEIKKEELRSANIPVVANVSADYVREPDEIRNNLIKQINSPVKWIQSMQKLIDNGYGPFIEVGPGKVLKGLLRQIDRKVVCMSAGNIEEIDKILSMA